MTPEQIGNIGSSFANKIYDLFIKDIATSIKGLASEVKNAAYTGSQEYVQRYIDRNGYLKVLRMPVAIKIDDIYINVRVLEDVNYSKYLNEEKLYKALKAQGLRLGGSVSNQGSHKEGINVADEERYLLLLGAPGGGKTTLLRKVGIECLRGNASTNNLNPLVPIFIELKNITSNRPNLIDYLIDEFAINGFPDPEALVKKGLKKGHFLILLDGLDEVPKSILHSFQSHVEDFVDKYPNNRYIISCRIAARPGGFKRFKNIEIMPFTVTEIEDFARKWFSTPLDKSQNIVDTFIDRINDPSYIATRELASSPLLLTMLCLVFNSEQDFPKNRAVLYRQAIDVLLKEWSSEKRINREPIYKDLTIPLEELMLSKLAYENFTVDNLFFKEHYLTSFISQFLNENINAPKFLDAGTILNEISIQQGLLVERAVNIYSFSHLTFQEYFAARYIDDFQLVHDIIPLKLFDPKWREVFLLLAGLMKTGADKLILAIFVELESIISKNQLISEYMIKYKRIINIDDTSLKERITIFSIIVYLLSEAGGDETFVSIIKHLDRTLGEHLDSIYISDGHLNSQFRWLILDKFLEENSLKYNYRSFDQMRSLLQKYQFSDINNLRGYIRSVSSFEREITLKDLLSFGKTFIFLLECKKNALYISNNTWEKIERSLF